ncbi:MAG: 16S rRNA processing protein RimM [Silvibacterium sp.]|nr:16S rRNA processing protein RimM [Silvibacterium sp.]
MSHYEWVLLAQIVRPQGRLGEVSSDLLTDFPERFADRKRLYLLGSEGGPAPVREMRLERHWMHKGRLILKFTGVDTMNDAETLRGLWVAIPSSERTPLTDDWVYISDLVGSELIDLASSQASIGRVKDFDREGGLLIVDSPNDAEVMIPFAKAYLVRIDPAANRIEMRLPEGLLDINAPMTDEERRELDSSSGSEQS